MSDHALRPRRTQVVRVSTLDASLTQLHGALVEVFTISSLIVHFPFIFALGYNGDISWILGRLPSER